jgi:nitroreductase
MTYENFMKLLHTRRSIRYFSDVPLAKEALTKILEAGRQSPSIQNIQPWRYHVITSPELKQTLMASSCYGNFVLGASAFIVVTCDRTREANMQETLWNPKELEYSCVSSMLEMMLAATTLGLGSCWVSLQHGPAHKALMLKNHEIIVGGMMFGSIKAGEEEPSREHNRMPLEKLVTWHN